MKVGYAFAYHHSDSIRSVGKQVVKESLESFYDSCEYEFETFVVDNQSEPRTSFDEAIDMSKEMYDNLNYTYIEDQSKRGLTGAWSDSIKQAIDAGCDIVILSGDDINYNKSINNFIDYIKNDPLSDNSVYGPVASGITNGIQLASEPTGEIFEIKGSVWLQHLAGHMYGFTKELYHRWAEPNGDLFVVDQHHNGGDGKWGGNEGCIMCWAEQGTRCVVVGTCQVHHNNLKPQSWKKPRDNERGN